MLKKRRLLLLFFVGLLFGFAFWLVNSYYSNKEVGYLVGAQVPEFELYDIESEELVSEEVLEGDYILLNFFASWCHTCELEHPQLLELAKEKKIKIYGVLTKDSVQNGMEWLNVHGNPYEKVLFDRFARMRRVFSLVGVPESFLIDKNHKIISHFRGPINIEAIRNIIN